jgi:cytochrome c oxidase assembly factor CtaG
VQLPPLWQVTPLGLIAVFVGITHEMGLRWLAHRQTPNHRRQTRRRSWAFYAGLLGLILVVSGPLERWGMEWLSVHMIIHLLEMFYLPPLLIIGAPWVPLVFAIPVDTRRRLLRTFYQSRSTAWLRRLASFLLNPIVAVVLFNGVMVLWHIPIVFDWASWHGWVMNWLMAPSFVIVGLLFWRVILPSHPWPARGSTRIQIGAIVATAFEMLVLAMAMSIFTKGPWYSMNVAMDGAAAALRDQRWAAGILWVCGDFWAVPALVLIVMRASAPSGGVSASFERVLGRA